MSELERNAEKYYLKITGWENWDDIEGRESPVNVVKMLADHHKTQLEKKMPSDEEIRIMAQKKATQTEDEMFFIAFQYGAKWLKQLLK